MKYIIMLFLFFSATAANAGDWEDTFGSADIQFEDLYDQGFYDDDYYDVYRDYYDDYGDRVFNIVDDVEDRFEKTVGKSVGKWVARNAAILIAAPTAGIFAWIVYTADGLWMAYDLYVVYDEFDRDELKMLEDMIKAKLEA